MSRWIQCLVESNKRRRVACRNVASKTNQRVGFVNEPADLSVAAIKERIAQHRELQFVPCSQATDQHVTLIGQIVEQDRVQVVRQNSPDSSSRR